MQEGRMTAQKQSATVELNRGAAGESVGKAYHPLPNLLTLSADEILSFYRSSQLTDFTRTLNDSREAAVPLSDRIGLLSRYLASFPAPGFQTRVQVKAVGSLFAEMHDHVMTHPVWVHQFFVRVAAGEITLQQLKVFAQHYFNQVKNTRQCVALALGRFHSLMPRPEGPLATAMSETTQVVLAGLLADEYGTAASGDLHDGHRQSEAAPPVDIRKLFSSITHPTLFRRFLDALGLSPEDYDVPMLHGVADNVLVQRILAGDPGFDELEALASVGLGMEWGVPAFFSMLIAGILKTARREGVPLSPASMEIWSSHVTQDVQHAIAVTIATSLYVSDESDRKRIRTATNVLMAFRYDMMSDIYEEVFGSRCTRIAEVALQPRHFPEDRRIEPLLSTARLQVSPSAVRDYESYLRKRAPMPMVFD
jgi:hypothetical protein